MKAAKQALLNTDMLEAEWAVRAVGTVEVLKGFERAAGWLKRRVIRWIINELIEWLEEHRDRFKGIPPELRP